MRLHDQLLQQPHRHDFLLPFLFVLFFLRGRLVRQVVSACVSFFLVPALQKNGNTFRNDAEHFRLSDALC